MIFSDQLYKGAGRGGVSCMGGLGVDERDLRGFDPDQ